LAAVREMFGRAKRPPERANMRPERANAGRDPNLMSPRPIIDH
jgi:hypothetical protein